MDERRIDGLSRLVARAGTSRRGLVAVAVGFVGLALPKLAASRQTCQPENAWCTLWLGCCPGTVCTMQLANPNLGVCLPGEDVTGAGFVFARVTPPTGSSASNSSSDSSRQRAQATATATGTATSTPTPTPTSGGGGGGGGGGNGNGGGKNNRNNKNKKNRKTNRNRKNNRNDRNDNPTPTPTPSADLDQVRLTMELDCETTQGSFIVRNTGDDSFIVFSYQAAGAAAPTGVNQRLGPGESFARDEVFSNGIAKGVFLKIELNDGEFRCFRGSCTERKPSEICRNGGKGCCDDRMRLA